MHSVIKNRDFRVESVRDGLVDEFHGGIIRFSGDEDKNPYYLRSCAKPLQASLLIEHGIELEEDELALICGSHAGEDCHIEVAQRLLNKFKIDKTLLRCGIHAPLSRSMQDKMLMRGEKADAIHNNCSGKHIGFLILCKKMGWDMKTYDEPNHPLQIEVKNQINKLCQVTYSYPATTDGCGGVNIEHVVSYPATTDGCGVPILSMPLSNLAKGFEALLNYPQIISAIKNNPYIFGGEDRTDTEIIQKTDNLIAKVGAGGLCAVLNIKEKKAFVLKINDCSYEARRIALFEVINLLGWGKIDYDNKIRTIAGKEVGFIKTTIN